MTPAGPSEKVLTPQKKGRKAPQTTAKKFGKG